VSLERLSASTILSSALGGIGAVLVGGVLVCVTLTAAQSTSARSGVYTQEQAAAGEKIYFDRCASCHGDDLAGIERAPALTGAMFAESWHGKDLRRLLDRIDTMPPSAPKTLSPADAVAVLAFILRASELPSGTTPLPADRARLAAILFERSTP
jgi:S-disulfanyl-L-cysteine oxidoreductase SoxD